MVERNDGSVDSPWKYRYYILLLLLSHFNHVRLCATPEMAAHQAPPSLGFSRPEHWSGLPFPSLMHESEKWKWSRSVMSNSSRPHGLQPTRLLCPWDFPGKSTGVGYHCLLHYIIQEGTKSLPWLPMHTGFAKNQFNETLISLIFPCLAKETNGFIIPEDCVCVCSVCVCVLQWN